MASVRRTEAIFVLGEVTMQVMILALLVPILALIGAALYLWRAHGWRNKKQLIVMCVVLAAALQLVNVTLLLTAQARLAG